MIHQITGILNALRHVDGVKSAIVVDRDGILIAKEESTETNNAEELASLFARAIHTFERTAANLGGEKEQINQLIIERQGDEKLMLSVSSQFMLAVMTRSNVNVGLIRMEMRETISQLAPLLEA